MLDEEFLDGQTLTFSTMEVDSQIALVRVVKGPDKGAELVVGEEPSTLGSSEHADHRLSDRGVSRLHCELALADGRLSVRDLHSKNGTWLGKSRIGEAQLAGGTRFQVGGTVLEAKVQRRRLKRDVWQGGDAFGQILGGAPAMHRLYAMLARVAPQVSPVLVFGESGTGKELVARELHESSPKRSGPFVVVDAGAMSRSLCDLELFGHEEGAFTGADRARAGAFERASGGTLFLDEIGELPIDLQPKLLRALESQSVQRIGSGEWKRVDVRVIAATHRPLRRMVNEGSFREDLLFRLAVFEVVVPPLRARTSDVPALAERFMAEMAVADPDARALVDEALTARAGYDWPGNVRELRSFVRRVVALGTADVETYGIDDAGPTVRADLPYHDAKRSWLDIFEREYLTRLIDETSGNVSEAARRSGISRGRLTELLQKHRTRG